MCENAFPQYILDFEDKMNRFFKSLKCHLSSKAADANMSLPQFHCIFIISKLGKVKMSDLAQFLSLSYASATNLVNKLCDDALVNRYDDPSDRRVVFVELSEKGREITSTLRNKDLNFFMDKMNKITEKDRKTLLEGISILVKMLEED